MKKIRRIIQDYGPEARVGLVGQISSSPGTDSLPLNRNTHNSGDNVTRSLSF